MKQKSAQIPVVKVLAIITFTAVLLSLFMFYLYLVGDTATRDATYNQQLLLTTLLSENCLLDNTGKIQIEKLSKTEIEKCLENHNYDSTLLKIESKVSQNSPIYIGDEQDYERINQFCGISSTHICSPELEIPLREDSQQHKVIFKFITEK